MSSARTGFIHFIENQYELIKKLQQYLTYNWQFILFNQTFAMLRKPAVIKDVLYEEAKFYFSHETLTPTNNGYLYLQYSDQMKKKITISQFYLLTSVYFLEKPMMICNYLQNEKQNPDFNWSGFLNILRTIALYYHCNELKLNALKKVFIAISIIQQIKTLFTVEIIQSLENLGIKNIGKTFHLPLSEHSSNNRNPINFLLADDSRGYSQILLTVNILHNLCPTDCLSQVWEKIVNIAGRYDLSWVRIFQIVMKQILKNDWLKIALFFLHKFKDGMGQSTMVSCLLLKLLNNYFQKGDKLIYRGQIDELMQEYSSQSSNISQTPHHQTLMILALMLKYQIVNYSSISSKLTPQTEFLLFLQQKRVQLHQSIFKECYIKSLNPQQRQERHRQQLWGQLIFSSKLELLTDLIFVNDFQHFKLIAAAQKIFFDYIYHPHLLFAFSELLEWIIDPLYKKIGYAHFFKITQKARPQFIDGYFKQCSQIDNYFVNSIREILNITKCYIFARRSTFIKICRLFREICQKNQRVPIQYSDIAVKIVIIIANIIKQYLLPALEFYNRDPTVSNELNSLLECFMFKVQFQIYHQCFKQRQLVNMHLAAIFEQTCNQQNQCMNKISEGNEKVIADNMGRLMYCHAFSSLVQIFKRITTNCKGFAENISTAVMLTPKLTKKIAFFFIFLQISENQESLIRRDSSITLSYTNLIKFAHLLLLKEKDNESYIKILFDYFIYRLKYKKNTANLSVFQFFHGQVQFLSTLLSEVLPIELSQDCIKDYNRVYLAAGPLLKLKLMQKIHQFNRDKYIRRNIIKTIFDSNLKKILQNKFYFILISLNDKMRYIASNQNYNISMHGYLHDQLLKTILNLISLAQFQVSPKQSERYFSTKIFEILVNTYNFPYELVFQMIRKSIATNILYHNYDIFNPTIWEQLKLSLVTALDLHFKQKTTSMEAFSSIPLNYLQSEDIKTFIKLDIFMYFWILNTEHFFFRNFYSQQIKQFKQKQLQKQKDRIVKEELQQFLKKLMQQQAQNHKLHIIQKSVFDGNYKILNKYHFYPLSLQFLKPESRNQIQKQHQFFQYFIKYCIFPRVLINNTEAFYSSAFIFRLFRSNSTHIINVVTIIAQIGKAIISYLPFSTERQASQLLPVFWNSLFISFRVWCNQNKMSQRLIQYKLIQEALHPDDYDEILFLLYESQTNMLKNMVMISNEIYCVKNCIYFLFKNQCILCKEHIEVIGSYIQQIKNKFYDSEDVILQVKRLSQIVRREQVFKKNMKTSIIRRYEQKYQINCSHQNLQSSKNENCSSIFKSEQKSGNDYFDYPELSTTNEYCNERSEEQDILKEKQSEEKFNEILEGREDGEDGENASKKGKSDKQKSQSISRIYQLR